MIKAEVSSAPSQEEVTGDTVPESFGIVIFGASGDLSNRKLIPALFKLSQAGLLPMKWYVVGLGRSEMSDAEFRRISKESIKSISKKKTVSSRLIEEFCKRLHYLSGNSQEAAYYHHLSLRLNQLDEEYGTSGSRLFYLATPPSLYTAIIRQLGGAGLHTPNSEDGWRRIIIEKPFGYDLPSAQKLDEEIRQVFREDQVYRIDHYLGKETVQNILFLRFANAIFEPIWDRRYIDHIQITVAEDLGIDHRAGYYEHAGALRDMFQNHLFQLLCLVSMEPPASFDADAVRDERLKVIKALRPIPLDRIDEFAVRGQYDAGVINCEQAVGYRSEKGVKPDSKTETFVALKLHIDNWPGALRDMFQNHLFQLLCLVSMEPPASFDADAVRDERLKVIKALRPIPLDRIDEFAVRGQYDAGVINCEQAVGYRSEKGVKPDSKTETFVALKLHIDNWRWQGVRFYLRSGKRLPSRVAEIAIEFKRVPHLLFKRAIPEHLEANTLVIRIQPDEGICLTFQAKHPGTKLCLDSVTMDFDYKASFDVASPEAYERLLLDCIIGDQTLFSRNDWLELSWAFLSPILKHWEETPAPDFPNYFAGSWGPKTATELIERDHRYWRQP